MPEDQPQTKPAKDQHRKPVLELYDPFERMFRPRRQMDPFGEMFEEKVVQEDF